MTEVLVLARSFLVMRTAFAVTDARISREIGMMLKIGAACSETLAIHTRHGFGTSITVFCFKQLHDTVERQNMLKKYNLSNRHNLVHDLVDYGSYLWSPSPPADNLDGAGVHCFLVKGHICNRLK